MSDKTEIIIKPDNFGEYDKDIIEYESVSKSLVVDNDAGLSIAAKDVSQISALKKAVKAKYKEIIDPIKEAKKKVDELFKPVIDRLDISEKGIKDKMAVYVTEKERVAREAEQERIRIEQEKALVEAERIRKEAEEKAKQENKDDMFSKINAKQIKLEAEKKAADLMNEASKPSESTKVKSDGIVYKEIWSFEITDEMEIPRKYLSVNEVAIREAIKSGIEIPGVKSFKKKIVSVK